MLEIDSTTHRAKAQRPRPAGTVPSAIVFHSGEGASAADDIDTLTHTGSSSHYYVTRKGKIFQFVDDSRRANHAGPNRFLGFRNWNEFSIGIETEHNKKQNWPQVQLDAISELLRHLIKKHGIIRERVAAHRWVRNPPSDEHQDPTGFTDPKLRGFITRLYPENERRPLMRVNAKDASVRRTASRDEDPIGTLQPGDVIEIEGEVQGQPVKGNTRWMKRVKEQGFVHSSLLDPVQVDL